MIGFQLIGVLHFIHDKNFIHRDVKPDNCVMGSDELNENLYLIDFGLAKKYRSSRTLQQYPMTKKKKLTGTARYASIHALEGLEQSRRDDMESVGYVMAYFLRGGLPWQGLKIKTKENKYKNILEKKKEISSAELFKGFPSEFAEILDNIKKLEYLEEPEYEMLRNKLLSLCKRLNYKFDFIYDWTTDKDLLKRKDKKCFTSIKTSSTLSLKNKPKRPKSKRKVKYMEKSVDELRHKSKKRKSEKNEEKNMENNEDDENKEDEDKNKNEEIKEVIYEDEKKEKEEKNENNDNENNEQDDNKEDNEEKDKEKSNDENNNADKDEGKDLNSDKNSNNSKDNNQKEEIINMGDEFNTIEEKNKSIKEEDNEKKSINSNNANKSQDSNNEEPIVNYVETKEEKKESNKSEENEEVENNKEGSKKSKSNCAEIGEEENNEDTEKAVCCLM